MPRIHAGQLYQRDGRIAMERALQHEEHQERPVRPTIMLPRRTLVVLCGPAGSGKSTFARKFVERHRKHGFKQTTVVSSDHCRALICDDETNQQVNRDTFDLFHYIIHKRMFQGRFTIADSTALQAEARRKLLELAQRHNYHTCLLVFKLPLETYIERDQHQARGRTVGTQVVAYHFGLLQQALQDIPQEGWEYIHILDEQRADIEIEIVSH
jgi:predicted kinase